MRSALFTLRLSMAAASTKSKYSYHQCDLVRFSSQLIDRQQAMRPAMVHSAGQRRDYLAVDRDFIVAESESSNKISNAKTNLQANRRQPCRCQSRKGLRRLGQSQEKAFEVAAGQEQLEAADRTPADTKEDKEPSAMQSSTDCSCTKKIIDSTCIAAVTSGSYSLRTHPAIPGCCADARCLRKVDGGRHKEVYYH